jgi:hypothetical protein
MGPVGTEPVVRTLKCLESQAVPPVGIDTDTNAGERLRLFGPIAVPGGVFGVFGKGGEKERDPGPIEAAREPTGIGTVAPDLAAVGQGRENRETLFPFQEGGGKKREFVFQKTSGRDPGRPLKAFRLE